MTTPTTAITVACHATAAANCRRVKPRAFKSAKSRLRRRTDAARVSANPAITPPANPIARTTSSKSA